MVACASCQAENQAGSVSCFICGHPLLALAAIRQGVVLASRYEILSPVGAGGMGMVYKARDRALDEIVAIKVLRDVGFGADEAAHRFRAEGKLARRVTHRNVCRIYEYGEEAGLRFISMELVDGVDLKQYLATRRGLRPSDALDIALQVAEGLAAIHEAGIIHRDLKPTNIMRDRQGAVRLMDFGLAKEYGAPRSAGTVTGLIVGTPHYMSPEQARGERVGFASDIYALGVVIFEIFTGRLPFQGENQTATILMHLNDAPPLADQPRLPLPLLDLLGRALAKNPNERQASVHEVVQALRAARPAVAAVGAGGSAHWPLRDAPRRMTAAFERLSRLTTVARRRQPSRPLGRRWVLVGGASAVAGLATLLAWPTRPSPTVGSSPAASPPRVMPSETPRLDPVATSSPPPPARGSTVPGVAAQTRTATGTPPPRAEPARVQPAVVEAVPSLERAAASPTPSSATPTAIAAPMAAKGFLDLVIVPWGEVTIDDAAFGRITSDKVPLDAGPHWVRVRHPEYRYSRKITILAGETFKLVVDLPEDGIAQPR